MSPDSSKNPPKFSSEKDYMTFKKELEAWSKITKHDKKNWGNVIALSLPDNDPSDIRRKVFAAIDVDGEEGYNSLMTYLDSEFARDEVQDTCEKIRSLVNYKKETSMNMKSYISGFDAKYVMAQKAGLTEMPQEYLMYHLMENCLLSDVNYRLVLSSIDFSKKTTLYKQAKLALIKYFGSVRQEPAPDPDDKVSMKVHDHQCKVDPEDTFYNRQASFQGYPNQLRPRQPFTSGQWRNPNPRPNTPRFQGQRFSKPLNSFNKDGKINLCNSCGSYRHLQANCPDRYETYFEQQEVQQEEDDQDPRESIEEEAETQFTGFATYETFNEGTFKPHEVFASVVIDTGCVKSVAGKNWFAEFCNTLSPSTRSKIKREESNKCFKFGGEMKKTSIGLYTVPCST